MLVFGRMRAVLHAHGEGSEKACLHYLFMFKKKIFIFSRNSSRKESRTRLNITGKFYRSFLNVKTPSILEDRTRISLITGDTFQVIVPVYQTITQPQVSSHKLMTLSDLTIFLFNFSLNFKKQSRFSPNQTVIKGRLNCNTLTRVCQEHQNTGK